VQGNGNEFCEDLVLCALAGVSPSAEFSELHRFLSSFDRMHGVCVLRISTTFTMGILLPHAIFQTRTILRAGRGHMSRHVHSRSSYENIVRCHRASKKVTLIMFHHYCYCVAFSCEEMYVAVCELRISDVIKS
jgi:hypothetical protein